jgi:hypothetical protein
VRNRDGDDPYEDRRLARPLQVTLSARSGPAALLMLFGLCAMFALVALLPNHLRSRISTADAEKGVRLILNTRLTASLQADLRTSGMRSPDQAMAEYWKAQLDSVAAIRFDGTRARRPVFDWTHAGPSWVVRTVQTDPGGAPATRYYLLKWGGFDRQVTRVRWWLAR